MRADRDGVLELPGRGAREVPDLREACDLVGFSLLLARPASTHDGQARAVPVRRARRADGQRAVERRARHRAAPAARRAARPAAARSASTASAPTTTNGAATSCASRSQIVEDAIADGIDLRGFFHWTGVDNYEWTYGFDVQFGCFTRDREPKGSAELLRDYATGR